MFSRSIFTFYVKVGLSSDLFKPNPDVLLYNVKASIFLFEELSNLFFGVMVNEFISYDLFTYSLMLPVKVLIAMFESLGEAIDAFMIFSSLGFHSIDVFENI